MRLHHGYKEGTPTTGAQRVKKKKYAPKHRILLQENSRGWIWAYYVGQSYKASSPRSWPKLSDASRNAVTFRALLAADDICEIVPPKDHKYSGD